MPVLADESVNYKIIKTLRNNQFEVISILEKNPGISDKAVLEQAISHQALLLTEDSDFGEWVFAHNIKPNGVIFLRYPAPNFVEITNSLIEVLNVAGDSLSNKFVVITIKKIRIREI